MVAIGGDDKKKLYIVVGLVAGLLVLVAFIFLRPKGTSDTGDSGAGATAAANKSAGANAASMPPGPGALAAAPGGAPSTASSAAGLGAAGTAAAGAAGGSAGSGAPTPTQLIALTKYRPDPFKPFYSPTLPPRSPLPAPLDIPGPSTKPSLPPGLPDRFGNSLDSSPAVTGLPTPNFFHQQAVPSLLPPTTIVASSDEPQRAPDKRLSGVILGDSIYAMIESGTGEDAVTRVVQPGDEVDGMKVLRIERIDDNGVQRTRMTVLQGGQEVFFDLQPAPQQTTPGAGTGGPVGGGAPAGPAIRPRGGGGPPVF